MKNIVLVDFPEQWPSLLPQLAQNLHSQVCLAAIVIADRKHCRTALITVTGWQQGSCQSLLCHKVAFAALEGSHFMYSAM